MRDGVLWTPSRVGKIWTGEINGVEFHARLRRGEPKRRWAPITREIAHLSGSALSNRTLGADCSRIVASNESDTCRLREDPDTWPKLPNVESSAAYRDWAERAPLGVREPLPREGWFWERTGCGTL